MEHDSFGVYSHPSFTNLYDELGSGWYSFTERVGLGGIFRLTSKGVIPFNPTDIGPNIRIHDVYDVLRAVEENRARKLIYGIVMQPEAHGRGSC